MANNFKVSVATRNAELDAMSVLMDGGFMDIYDGAQPATPETALGAQVLLASLPLNADFAPAAAAALLTANAITSDLDADGTGTATWFRCYKANHTTAVSDGTVGTAGTDAIINSTAIAIHARVDCTSLTIAL
jgi:hypothetical protein